MKQIIHMLPSSFRSQLIFFLLFCIGGLLTTDALASKTEKHLLQRGEALLMQGKYLESIGLLHEIATHSSEDEIRATALYLIAKAEYNYLDTPDAALKRYQAVHALYPETEVASKALFQSGIILFDRKQYKQAVAIFSRYIQQYPKGAQYKSAEIWITIATPLIREKSPVPEPIIKKPKPQPLQIVPVVRVLIQKKKQQVTVKSNRMITVKGLRNQSMLYSGWGPVHFRYHNKQLFINGWRVATPSCRVTSAAGRITVNQRTYRGALVITRELGDGLDVINHVSVEKYLYGVVPKEMPVSWAKQALMAQAVAARTYALYIQSKSTHPFYDLEATTASQVYGGCNAEFRRATEAVNATRGQVMTHNGKLIIAYFHSDSGGYTEDPTNVWNTDKIPYLSSRPDYQDPQFPIKQWEYFLSYRDAVRCLNRYGLALSRLDRIRVMGKSKSGRYTKIRIYSDHGISELSSNHFRAAIGESRIKSTLFQMYAHTGGILFRGKGYGHGVGMSQWGARRMAHSGSTYQDILKFYYKGIKIERLQS